jgi:hypothetical protein
MRITLSGNNLTGHTRAYGEYRFFTSVARHAALVRAVDITLKRVAEVNPRVQCAVVVDLGASGRVKTQARAPHPTAAIDRAAERVAWLLDRRTRATAFIVKSSRFSL